MKFIFKKNARFFLYTENSIILSCIFVRCSTGKAEN